MNNIVCSKKFVFNILIASILLVTILFIPSKQIFAQSSGWTTTGSMNAARQWHTGTLLQNGQVLVTGGHNFTSALASSELYDPSTSLWTNTLSPMSSARYHHVAVLLANGKVLVAGGQDNSSVLASAEIYDPNTDTWTPTGSMNIPRIFSTATLLQDGKVLVAGGCNELNCFFTTLNSAELYDPNSGTWSSTGAMSNNRNLHKATSLPNGKILVTGGVSSFESSFIQTLNSVELYDPGTGTWQTLAPMNSERSRHTATLLSDGKVLVVGGLVVYHYWNGGYCYHTISDVEIYDSITNTWEVINPMNHIRTSHVASLLPNGKVIVAAGQDYSDGCYGFHAWSIGTAEIFDPATKTWVDIIPLTDSRGSSTATLLENANLLVTGGYYENYPASHSLSTSELYYENYSPIAIAGPD